MVLRISYHHAFNLLVAARRLVLGVIVRILHSGSILCLEAPLVCDYR